MRSNAIAFRPGSKRAANDWGLGATGDSTRGVATSVTP